MRSGTLIRRIRIRNYRSIADSDVQLGQLTMVVGRNGAGKSNFLDALRFVRDGLDTTLDRAVRIRGGIESVRRYSSGHPHHIGLLLEVTIPEGVAEYAFEIGPRLNAGFRVLSESLKIILPDGDVPHCFRIHEGRLLEARVSGIDLKAIADSGIASSAGNIAWPAPSLDRLFLVAVSGLPPFRSTYDALRTMGFYNINPDAIRSPQSPDDGELLKSDGGNLASVAARLIEDRPDIAERIKDYLRRVVPEIADFRCVAHGEVQSLEFAQILKGSKSPYIFSPRCTSDGTLRVFGILVAAMQLIDRANPMRLVGLEEPESAIHPAAAGLVLEALREAARSTQIIVTTHSPDLLDRFDDSQDDLLVAQSLQGTTTIGPADPASLEAIKSHLYTPGDLLRMDQLQPAGMDFQQQLDFPVESKA